jgi:hypothetical protein
VCYIYFIIFRYINSRNSTKVITVFDTDFHAIKTITLNTTYLQPVGCSEEYYFISRKSVQNQYGMIDTISDIPLDDNLKDATPEIFYQFVPETISPGIMGTSN